jgi:hypothetical protein
VMVDVAMSFGLLDVVIQRSIPSRTVSHLNVTPSLLRGPRAKRRRHCRCIGVDRNARCPMSSSLRFARGCFDSSRRVCASPAQHDAITWCLQRAGTRPARTWKIVAAWRRPGGVRQSTRRYRGLLRALRAPAQVRRVAETPRWSVFSIFLRTVSSSLSVSARSGAVNVTRKVRLFLPASMVSP